MNLTDLFLIVFLAALFSLSVYLFVSGRKKGMGCCGSCASCGRDCGGKKTSHCASEREKQDPERREEL